MIPRLSESMFSCLDTIENFLGDFLPKNAVVTLQMRVTTPDEEWPIKF